MITFGIPINEIRRDMRAAARDLERAQKRGISDTLRRAQTYGRRKARERTGLKAAPINRRVRAYPRDQRLWFGASPTNVANLSRDAGLRLKAPQRKGAAGRGPGGTGAAVTFRGRRMPGAFVPRHGRLRGKAFRLQADGRLMPVNVSFAKQMERAFRETEDVIPEIYGEQFTAAAKRTLK